MRLLEKTTRIAYAVFITVAMLLTLGLVLSQLSRVDTATAAYPHLLHNRHKVFQVLFVFISRLCSKTIRHRRKQRLRCTSPPWTQLHFTTWDEHTAYRQRTAWLFLTLETQECLVAQDIAQSC